MKEIILIVNIFVVLGYIFLQYEGKYTKLLDSFILFILFTLIGVFTSMKITSWFHNDIKTYTIGIAGILIFYMIYCYVEIHTIHHKVKLPSYANCILLLPIGSVLCINFLFGTSENLNPLLFSSIIVLGISFIGIILYKKTIYTLHNEHEKTLQRYMETSSQNKYDLLNQQYQNSFNLLHELMHKCNELVVFMKNKNYHKVEEELNQICDATFKEFNEIYSNSVVFNTLLSNRKQLLQKYGISVKSTIEFNNFDFISFSNQVDLFNTLLDFILAEAAQSNTNKLVFIKSNIVANQVILSFRFANNNNQNLQGEINAALSNILHNYEAILSVNNIDENTTSLLLLFPNQNH